MSHRRCRRYGTGQPVEGNSHRIRRDEDLEFSVVVLRVRVVAEMTLEWVLEGANAQEIDHAVTTDIDEARDEICIY